LIDDIDAIYVSNHYRIILTMRKAILPN